MPPIFEPLVKVIISEKSVDRGCSGTTAVAAVKNKRRYIGYELSEEYIHIANNRITNIGKSLF